MSADSGSRRKVFDSLYEADPDPWCFETSDYEAAKRTATIDAFEGRCFGRLFEVGCSTGRLTEELVKICAELVAVDVSPIALRTARKRLGFNPNIELHCAEVPTFWPAGFFDCVVLSEVLYFLSTREIIEVSKKVGRSLVAGGVCLLVNWTGENDCPVSGTEAVRIFRQGEDWDGVTSIFGEKYRIDLLSR